MKEYGALPSPSVSLYHFFMQQLLATLLSFFITSFSQAETPLKRYCDQAGGVVIDKFQCPKSKLNLKWNFCFTKSPAGAPLFFDGCTGPSGGHTELFYPACIKHDYCYHHEPATNGLSRSDCDKQFLNNALDLCVGAPDQEKCRLWAQAMYKALVGFGDIAFNCANYKADYE